MSFGSGFWLLLLPLLLLLLEDHHENRRVERPLGWSLTQAGWRAFARYRAPMIKTRTGRITAKRFFKDLSGNLTACEGAGHYPVPKLVSPAFQRVAVKRLPRSCKHPNLIA